MYFMLKHFIIDPKEAFLFSIVNERDFTGTFYFSKQTAKAYQLIMAYHEIKNKYSHKKIFFNFNKKRNIGNVTVKIQEFSVARRQSEK